MGDDLGDVRNESSVVKAKSMKARPSSTINPNWAQLQARLKCGIRKPVVSSLHPSSVLNETNEKPLLGKRKGRPEEQAPLSAAEILTPKNSDCSVTDVVAMDCEMVGVSYQGNKSALGRVTLVNSWGNVIYDEYVRPLERVVDFRSEISGIRPHNLKKAKDFQTVQKDVAALIDDRILVGHALQHDLKALLLSHPKKDTRDTSHYLPLKSKEGKTRALRDLALEHLGVKIQQKQHCPIEDARSALHIYQKHKKEWEKLAKQQWRLRNKQKRKPRNAPKSD